MRFRDGCAYCFTERGDMTPHDGRHLVTPTWGGKASCPTDDVTDDPDLLEELFWVALEEALTDAGQDLPEQEDLARRVANVGTDLLRTAASLWHKGLAYRWEERTDEHLDLGGTLDVVCLITGQPILVDDEGRAA